MCLGECLTAVTHGLRVRGLEGTVDAMVPDYPLLVHRACGSLGLLCS